MAYTVPGPFSFTVVNWLFLLFYRVHDAVRPEGFLSEAESARHLFYGRPRRGGAASARAAVCAPGEHRSTTGVRSHWHAHHLTILLFVVHFSLHVARRLCCHW